VVRFDQVPKAIADDPNLVVRQQKTADPVCGRRI
jgi:hypothetical protein